MQKGEFFVTGEVFLLDIGLSMGAIGKSHLQTNFIVTCVVLSTELSGKVKTFFEQFLGQIQTFT